IHLQSLSFFFFFMHTAPTALYTLSLHDALPISRPPSLPSMQADDPKSIWETHMKTARFTPLKYSIIAVVLAIAAPWCVQAQQARSEEHTSELQSQSNLVCRLLLEKKKKTHIPHA